MEPRPGIYRHYKGHIYEVLGVGLHTETEEPLVVYRTTVGEPKLWVRPQAMFNETVTVDGEVIPRFTRMRHDEEMDADIGVEA